MQGSLSRALRERGLDVETAFEAGMIERLDSEHLVYSTSQQRVLCTYNIGDFWSLHLSYLRSGLVHTGLVLMPQQRYGLGELLRRLWHISTVLSHDEMVNRAEFISSWEPARS